MADKLHVLLDMDEVLVDLLSGWLRAYNAYTGETLTREQITDYHFSSIVNYPTTLMAQIDAAHSCLFADAPPLLGAVDGALALLTDDRVRVTIVTYARHEARCAVHQQKLEWLRRELGEAIDLDDVVFTRRKELVRGDVLIEDNPETLKKWLAANKRGRGYMIEQPWNRNSVVNGCYCVPDLYAASQEILRSLP